MPQRKPLDLGREVLEAFEHSNRVTEYLVSVVPDELWHAPPLAKGRTIAAIVAHMFGLKRTFIKMAGVDGGAKKSGDLTKAEALEALRETRAALMALFQDAVENDVGRIKGMPRRTAMMMAYLMQHDAHHRGQIVRQMSEVGHKLEGKDTMIIWGWRKLPEG